MFVNQEKWWSNPKSKSLLLSGIILILIAAVIALLVLLNYYFTNRLTQIQNLTIQNSQRLGQIENFLNALQNQLPAAKQDQPKE